MIEIAKSFILIGANASAQRADNPSCPFVGGLCERCGAGIGSRTEAPLVLESAWQGDVLLIDRMLPSSLLVTDAFLRHFPLAELCGAELREAKVTFATKRRYFEIIGGSICPVVAIRHAQYGLGSWKCSRCNFVHYGTPRAEGVHPDVICVVARSSLPRELPTAFVIGSSRQGFDICVQTDAWRRVKGKSGTKGTSCLLVAIADDDDVDLCPAFPDLEE
jgi:hypothetical protein